MLERWIEWGHCTCISEVPVLVPWGTSWSRSVASHQTRVDTYFDIFMKGNDRFPPHLIRRKVCHYHVWCNLKSHLQKCSQLALGFSESMREYTNCFMWQQSRHQGENCEGKDHHLPQKKESPGTILSYFQNVFMQDDTFRSQSDNI